MSTITIYYDDPKIQFTRKPYRFDCSGGRNTPDLVYKGMIFSLNSIVYDKDKDAIYIEHIDPNPNNQEKRFVLKINTTIKTTFSSDKTFDDYLTDYPNKPVINVLSLIDNSILKPQDKKVEKGTVEDANKKEIEVYVCDIGRICIKQQIRNAFKPPIGEIGKDRDKIIPPNTKLENKEVRIIFSSTPKKTIRNCVRLNESNDSNVTERMKKDFYLKNKSKSIFATTTTYVVMTFAAICMVFGIHIWYKDPLSDLWGFPIPQTSGFMGGGLTGVGGMTGGAACYIPDETPIRFPKPDLTAFGKMAAFLFFIQTIIYGATRNNDDWLGVGIASVVLLALISGGLRVFRNVGFDDGINLSNMFLFSEISPPAKIPALLMYLTFYTSFIRLVTKQYQKDEIIAFVLNFLLFALWGVALVSMEIKKMTHPAFWGMAIIMLGLSIWYMTMIFEPPKKETETDAATVSLPSTETSTIGLGTSGMFSIPK